VLSPVARRNARVKPGMREKIFWENHRTIVDKLRSEKLRGVGETEMPYQLSNLPCEHQCKKAVP